MNHRGNLLRCILWGIKEDYIGLWPLTWFTDRLPLVIQIRLVTPTSSGRRQSHFNRNKQPDAIKFSFLLAAVSLAGDGVSARASLQDGTKHFPKCVSQNYVNHMESLNSSCLGCSSRLINSCLAGCGSACAEPRSRGLSPADKSHAESNFQRVKVKHHSDITQHLKSDSQPLGIRGKSSPSSLLAASWRLRISGCKVICLQRLRGENICTQIIISSRRVFSQTEFVNIKRIKIHLIWLHLKIT